jgi:CDP-diacylglycerol---serine O-phosphatidyltransferase
MKQIPNLLTLLNLIFGCLAIVSVLQNGITIQHNPEGAQFIDLPEKIWMASFYIAMAALVDFVDGFAARLLKVTSPIGKELDSLADVVSFGVAPSMIIFQFLRMSFADEENGITISLIWLVPAFFIAAAAAYRLAKFNLDNTQQYGFKGIPTPLVGLLTASLPLIYWHSESPQVIGLLTNSWFLFGYIILLSWLMISDLPMMALKFRDGSLKNNLPKIILLVISILAVILFQWHAVPVIFVAYILLSLIFQKKET